MKTSITKVVVEGFKAIKTSQTLAVRKLTIIAGANSAGKSSMMQPLLLLKQSIESPYDPGSLKLLGANVKYSSGDQVLTKGVAGMISDTFSVGVEVNGQLTTAFYRWENKKGFELLKVVSVEDGKAIEYSPHTPPEVIAAKIADAYAFDIGDGKKREIPFVKNLEFSLKRDRSYYTIIGSSPKTQAINIEYPIASNVVAALKNLIHLPGLRGNPERTYPVTAVGSAFPGLFQDYTASIILHWENNKVEGKMDGLREDMKKLGLSWKVKTARKDDTQVEIEIGRLPKSQRGGAQDLVNIADVGLGVSQTLPVLVALHAATEDHVVYIEQPEIHLHPRAQVLLAEVIVSAVNRGVTLILETHSAVLIRKIQTLVAVGSIKHTDISLNWFSRDADGYTVVQNSVPDQDGAYGDWPEDFDDTALKVESDYLSAVEKNSESASIQNRTK